MSEVRKKTTSLAIWWFNPKDTSEQPKRTVGVCRCAAPKPPTIDYIGSKLVLCSWCGKPAPTARSGGE
jgi:hypothetical protein